MPKVRYDNNRTFSTIAQLFYNPFAYHILHLHVHFHHVVDFKGASKLILVIALPMCGTSLLDQDLKDRGGKDCIRTSIPQILEQGTVVDII